MQEAGFCGIVMEIQPIFYEEDVRQFLATVKRRDTCSQVLAISESDYREGIARLEKAL